MARLTKHEKIKVAIGAATIVLIILFAATAHLHVFDFLRIWPVSEDKSADPIEEPRNQTVKYPLDKVSGLSIDWMGDDINIVAGDVEQIEVTEEIGVGVSEAAAEPASISLAGNGSLSVSDTIPNGTDLGSLHTDGRKHLTVTLPADAAAVLDSVSIDGVYSTFNVKGAAAKSLSLDGIGGDVDIDGEVRDQLSVDGMLGDLTFKLSGTAPRGIELDGMLGNSKITLPEGSGFTVDVDGMSANLDSDLPLEHDGNVYRYGDGTTEISVSGRSLAVQPSFSCGDRFRYVCCQRDGHARRCRVVFADG